MAWLESLAARQGVPEEELTTRPEERPEAPPAWVQEEAAGEQLAAEEQPAVLEQPTVIEQPPAEIGTVVERSWRQWSQWLKNSPR